MFKKFFEVIKPKKPLSNYCVNIGLGFILISALFDIIEFIQKKLS